MAIVEPALRIVLDHARLDSTTPADVADAAIAVGAALRVRHGDGSAEIVYGDRSVALDGIDIGLLGVLVELDGDVVETGAGAAASGHPFVDVAAQLVEIARRGGAAPRSIVTGALTAPVEVGAGSFVSVSMAHLGTIHWPAKAAGA